MKMIITASATKRIQELLEKQNKQALRVSVEGGGCSGYLYNYQLTDDINADDVVLEQGGVKIVIDAISQDFLNNCSLDFVQELGGNYFNIKNPQATAKCGCGNSFAV